MPLTVKDLFETLSTNSIHDYAQCCYDECHVLINYNCYYVQWFCDAFNYAGYSYAVCRFAVCRYTQCPYAGCRYAG
jgi:hypothetical protein